jgi:hypothetical protein
MAGCSSVSSLGGCGAKCGVLGRLRGVLNGKKQQHSVGSTVSSSWREIWIGLRSLMRCLGWSVQSKLEATP